MALEQSFSRPFALRAQTSTSNVPFSCCDQVWLYLSDTLCRSEGRQSSLINPARASLVREIDPKSPRRAPPNAVSIHAVSESSARRSEERRVGKECRSR